MSIEAQEDACREYAARKNLDVYKVYIDRAQSGTSDQRKEFQKMISDASERPIPFHTLIVHKLDRFARNRMDSVKYKHILKKLGIKLVSVSQPMIGSGSPEDVILESLLEGMDEFYSMNLARESMKGMLQNVKLGFSNGGYAPYGFDFENLTYEGRPKKKLKINEIEASVVKKIYSFYLQRGLGFKGIANELNKQGVKKRNGAPWDKNSIRWILINEKNAGDTTLGKRRKKNFLSQDFIPDPITIQDTHKGIIDRKSYKKTLDFIEGKYSQGALQKGYITNSDYLLSGIIKCGTCGAHFIGTSAKGGKYRYYTCGTRLRSGKTGCCEPQIKKEAVEAKAKKMIKQKLISRENIMKTAVDLHNTLKEDSMVKEKEKIVIKKNISSAERRLEKLYDVIETSEELCFDDLAPRIRQLKEDISDLQEQQRRLDVALNVRTNNSGQTDEEIIQAYADLVVDFFKDENLFKKKSVVTEVIKSIEVKDGQFFFAINSQALTL